MKTLFTINAAYVGSILPSHFYRTICNASAIQTERALCIPASSSHVKYSLLCENDPEPYYSSIKEERVIPDCAKVFRSSQSAMCVCPEQPPLSLSEPIIHEENIVRIYTPPRLNRIFSSSLLELTNSVVLIMINFTALVSLSLFEVLILSDTLLKLENV